MTKEIDVHFALAAEAQPEMHLPEGARAAHLEKIAKTVSTVSIPASEPQPAPTAKAQGRASLDSSHEGAGR